MDLIYFLIDFILHIDVHLAELVAEYGVWVYAILFLILFLRVHICQRLVADYQGTQRAFKRVR
ncbi:hypothetical protein ACUOBA_09860, partial [Escherichia coli]